MQTRQCTCVDELSARTFQGNVAFRWCDLNEHSKRCSFVQDNNNFVTRKCGEQQAVAQAGATRFLKAMPATCTRKNNALGVRCCANVYTTRGENDKQSKLESPPLPNVRQSGRNGSDKGVNGAGIGCDANPCAQRGNTGNKCESLGSGASYRCTCALPNYVKRKGRNGAEACGKHFEQLCNYLRRVVTCLCIHINES